MHDRLPSLISDQSPTWFYCNTHHSWIQKSHHTAFFVSTPYQDKDPFKRPFASTLIKGLVPSTISTLTPEHRIFSDITTRIATGTESSYLVHSPSIPSQPASSTNKALDSTWPGASPLPPLTSPSSASSSTQSCASSNSFWPWLSSACTVNTSTQRAFRANMPTPISSMPSSQAASPPLPPWCSWSPSWRHRDSLRGTSWCCELCPLLLKCRYVSLKANAYVCANSILWVAVFGLFGKMFIPANPQGDQGIQTMKNAVWVDLCNMLLWLISTIYSTIMFFTHRGGRSLHTGRAAV